MVFVLEWALAFNSDVWLEKGFGKEKGLVLLEQVDMIWKILRLSVGR